MIPMVLVLAFWCVNTDVNAQTKNDLDPSTLELLGSAFEEETSNLLNEINDPSNSENLYSSRVIILYYESVYGAFDTGDIDLRDAFISQIPVLQYGRVATHQDFISALFTDSIGDEVVTLEMVMGGEAPLTSEFKDLLLDIELNNNDLSKINNLFSFIRNNK